MLKHCLRLVLTLCLLHGAVAAPTEAGTLGLSGASQYTPPACAGAPFPDVVASDPYCGFIGALAVDGVMDQCGDGKFCPDAPVTRRQLAKFLVRTMRGTASWDAWRDGPVSPGGLNWGAKTASPNVGTMMEYGMNIGAESGIYFDDESIILWAPGGTGLLRLFDRSQGTADEVYRFADGHLSFRPVGLNGTGADSSFELRFFDDAAEANESIRWDDGDDRFEMTNDLALTSSDPALSATSGSLRLRATGGGGVGLVRVFDANDAGDEVLRIADGSLSFRPAGLNGTGADSSIVVRFFDEGEDDNERFRWDAAEKDFYLSDALVVHDDLDEIFGTNGAAGTLSAAGFNTNLSIIEFELDENNDFADSELVIQNHATDIARFKEVDFGLEVNNNVTANAFDLAESFVRGEALEAGDVVAADPARPEMIRRASSVDGAAVVGVVSTKPGLRLGGALMDDRALDAWSSEVRARFSEDLAALRQAALARDPALANRLTQIRRPELLHGVSGENRERLAAKIEAETSRLEKRLHARALDSFAERTFAPVALAGRVPVKVDATFGEIRVGDALAASSVPGLAMRASGPGWILGTALEPLREGRGKVLMMVGRGWLGGDPGDRGEATDPKPEEKVRIAVPTEPEQAKPSEAESLAVEIETVRVQRGGHAELMAVSQTVETGDVLVMDEWDSLRPCERAEDGTVVGVAAARAGVLAGRRVFGAEQAAVVVSGVAWMKVDAGYGAVARGDLLVASPTRGHAMRADDPPAGTVVGKALGALADGAGLVRVVVTLR